MVVDSSMLLDLVNIFFHNTMLFCIESYYQLYFRVVPVRIELAKNRTFPDGNNATVLMTFKRKQSHNQ